MSSPDHFDSNDIDIANTRLITTKKTEVEEQHSNESDSDSMTSEEEEETGNDISSDDEDRTNIKKTEQEHTTFPSRDDNTNANEKTYEWLLTAPEHRMILKSDLSVLEVTKNQLESEISLAEKKFHEVGDTDDMKRKIFIELCPEFSPLQSSAHETITITQLRLSSKTKQQFHDLADATWFTPQPTTNGELFECYYKAWYNPILRKWKEPSKHAPADLLEMIQDERNVIKAKEKLEAFLIKKYNRHSNFSQVKYQTPFQLRPEFLQQLNSIVDQAANDKGLISAPQDKTNNNILNQEIKRASDMIRKHKRKSRDLSIRFVFPIEFTPDIVENLRISRDAKDYSEKFTDGKISFVVRRPGVACNKRDLAVIDDQARMYFREMSCKTKLIQMFTSFQDNFSEAMRQLGQKYGVCVHCNHKLSDAESIRIGFNPQCAKYWGFDHEFENNIESENDQQNQPKSETTENDQQECAKRKRRKRMIHKNKTTTVQQQDNSCSNHMIVT